jgi:transposase
VFRLNEQMAVWLHRDAIDFRKNINGLAALVEHELGLDPFACALYVFTNRRRDRVKILGWDRNGFWLLHKRLEQDRFVWPRRCPQQVVDLTVQQLHWLLDGIDLAAMQGHRELKALRAA